MENIFNNINNNNLQPSLNKLSHSLIEELKINNFFKENKKKN